MKKILFSIFVYVLLFSSCATDSNQGDNQNSGISNEVGVNSNLIDQENARKNADQTYLSMSDAQYETFFTNSRNGILDAIYKAEKRLKELESSLKDQEKLTGAANTQKLKATKNRIQSEKDRVVNLNRRLNNFDNHVNKFEQYPVEQRPLFMEELRALLKI
jgi:peptidoglycan hydrolase CwlO-like protein